MTVVGLSGYGKAGKTAAANYIEEKYGIKRRHIAEPLRAMLAVLLRANGLSSEMIDRYLVGDLKESVIPELGVSSRHLQITLGTEWGRTHVGQDVWANTWIRGIAEDESVMNDSVRFPNEERVIRQRGGFSIMIDRVGTGPIKFNHWIGKKLYEWFGVMWGVHDSERIDRLKADYVVKNDGTLEDMYRKIDAIFRERGIIDMPDFLKSYKSRIEGDATLLRA